MRIKKFKALNLAEGKALIKKELGEEAIILSTRTIADPENDGIELLEIVAAIDNSPSRSTTELFNQNKDKGTEEKESTSELIISELTKFGKMLKDIHKMTTHQELSTLKPSCKKFYELIRSRGYDETASLEFCIDMDKSGIHDYNQIVQNFALNIGNQLKFGWQLNEDSKKSIIIFYGHSGSGKTTCLVKLALLGKLAMNWNVLLVSADSKKVGGFEQLSTFSAIAGIPSRSIYNSNELNTLLSKETERDLILIDTSGNSHSNIKHFDDLKEIVSNKKITRRYLIVDATLSKLNLIEQLNAYSKLNPNALVVTKTDECTHYSDIFTGIATKNIPMAYITTGQTIPDDIEPASLTSIENLIRRELAG